MDNLIIASEWYVFPVPRYLVKVCPISRLQYPSTLQRHLKSVRLQKTSLVWFSMWCFSIWRKTRLYLYLDFWTDQEVQKCKNRRRQFVPCVCYWRGTSFTSIKFPVFYHQRLGWYIFIAFSIATGAMVLPKLLYFNHRWLAWLVSIVLGGHYRERFFRDKLQVSFAHYSVFFIHAPCSACSSGRQFHG